MGIDLSQYGFDVPGTTNDIGGTVPIAPSPSAPTAAATHYGNPNNPQGEQELAHFTRGTSPNTFINFLSSLPNALSTVTVGGPTRFATSGGEALDQTIRSKGKTSASGKTYNIPGVQPFQSYQTAAGNRAATGQNPLLNAGQSALEIGGDAAATIGAGEGAANLPDALSATETETQQAALDAIKTKLSPDEQAQAAAEGRTQVSGPGKKITYQPSTQDTRIANTLQPLVEDGKIVSPKAPEDFLNNITAVQDELECSVQNLRQGIKNTEGTWNANDLNKQIFQTKPPMSIRPNDAMVENLQNATFKLIQDADKTPEGLLDLRQNFDSLVRKEFPNIYDQTEKPTLQYVRTLRNTINDFTEAQLPDGKLPDGTDFRAELKRQSDLINAREAMGQKISEEMPENSTRFTRWMKSNPEKARILRRVLIGGAISAAGVYAGAKALNKAVTGQ